MQRDGPSSTQISVRTLYRYIDEKLIPNVKNENILHKSELPIECTLKLLLT